MTNSKSRKGLNGWSFPTSDGKQTHAPYKVLMNNESLPTYVVSERSFTETDIETTVSIRCFDKSYQQVDQVIYSLN